MTELRLTPEPIPRKEPPLSEDDLTVFGYFGERYHEKETSIDDFSDVISEDVRKQDTERVHERRQSFVEKSERSAFLEALFASTEVAEANWFGTETTPLFVVQTAQYDDFEHGVDLVWEWNVGTATPLRLAVDVTTAEDTSRLREKLERMHRGIMTGRLGSVKYFVSEITKERGSLSQIPHVVAGTTVEGVNRLAKTFLPYVRAVRELEALARLEKKIILRLEEKKHQKALEHEVSVRMREFEHDPVSFVVLDQIQSQLENQTIDALIKFFETNRQRAFPQAPEAHIRVGEVYRALFELLIRSRKNEPFYYEWTTLEGRLRRALPDIKTSDETRAAIIKKIFEAFEFIRSLREKKEKTLDRRTAQGVITETARTTHQELIAPWMRFSGFPELPELRL